MKIKYVHVIFVALIIISLVSFTFIAVPVSYAQASVRWSKPINLSNAGASTNPVMVIDPTGTIHVIWVDQFEGYKYTKSTDGLNWTPPTTMRFPFSPKNDSEPVLLADQEGGIHALWQNKKTNALYHSKVISNYDLSSKWTGGQKLADSVLAFDAVLSAKGILHLGYVRGIMETESNSNLVLNSNVNPTGVYYRQFKGNSWSKPQSLYSSQYFRSLKLEDANIHLAVSEENELETIHMVWDDRPQKRILWSKSVDGGSVWEGPTQVQDSETSSGPSTLFNINVGIVDSKLLWLWQSGAPGTQCSLYSELSTDRAEQSAANVKLVDGVIGCPQASQFIILKKDFVVILVNILGDLSLVAWNGSDWSKPQTQNEITTFINPATLDSVLLGCQRTTLYGGHLFVVGCDKGNGGDIWFSSRSLGAVEDWFPVSTTWTSPVEVVDIDQQISQLTSVADNEGNIHSFWVQTPLLSESKGGATIQYARWDRTSWSSPETILSKLKGNPKQLTAQADRRNRLLLAWVESETGDMFFTWAASDHANAASEWQTPQYIPSSSQANSSPDILVDQSGKIVVVYAIPINEGRGIYLVESDDGGKTWTQPLQVFDAASAGWDIADQPEIGLTGDGRLHILFRQYSFQGESRPSRGLYYAQSVDGGVTWTMPQVVSEYPVPWSEIVGYDKSILHRLWQEYRQSMFVTFHEISRDGGVTWSKPLIISSNNANVNLITQTMDGAGNLHFLELSGDDPQSILSHMWNGASWISQEPKELYIPDRGVLSSITAGVSSEGDLLLSTLVDYPQLNNELRSSILSVSKSLEIPNENQTPYPAIIPNPATTVIATSEALVTAVPPTSMSPITTMGDPQPYLSKNLVGFLLLGGVLVLLSVIFWPLSRKQDNPKKVSK